MSTRGFARLGMLAMGLGVGAAVAHSPVALADSANDWLSSIDTLLSGEALPAPATGLDLAIAFNGMSLVSDGTASADSGATGDYGLAIAYGDNARAFAGGLFDSAFADGKDATADVGSGNFDSGTAIGTETNASVGIGSYDYAFACGTNNSEAEAAEGNHDTAIVLGSDDGTATAFQGNNDFAMLIGSGAKEATAGSFSELPGNNNVAFVVDPFGTVGSFATAGSSETAAGNFDLAGAFGDSITATATGANFLVDIPPLPPL